MLALKMQDGMKSLYIDASTRRMYVNVKMDRDTLQSRKTEENTNASG